MVVELFAFCKKDPEKDFFLQKAKAGTNSRTHKLFLLHAKRRNNFWDTPKYKNFNKNNV